MATAKPIVGSGRRRRWGRKLLLLLVLAAVAAGAWFWQPLRAFATTGASYGARMACACRFVERRTMGSCRDDFEPGMGLVHVSADEAARSVTATFPLLARQTATFRDGDGCVLETWEK